MTIVLRPLGVALIASALTFAGCTSKSSGLITDPAETNASAPNPGNGSPGPGPGAIPDPDPVPVSNNGSTGNSGGAGNGNPGNSGSGGGEPEPVPEPGTMLLFGTGLTGLALWRTRRRRDALAQG